MDSDIYLTVLVTNLRGINEGLEVLILNGILSHVRLLVPHKCLRIHQNCIKEKPTYIIYFYR